tara:strand:+ start:553 stop:1092 length:540 start_codon:yes stop_codon:yes gene_type:complete
MCKVCDREEIIWKKFMFWDDANYCSYYCQRFDELKLKKYRPSDHICTGHLEYYPPIETSCEMCGDPVILRWNTTLCNKAFCSEKCVTAKPKRKRSLKHYFPLKILKHSKVPLTAEAFQSKLDGQLVRRYSATSVAQILRIYVKKGIVIKTAGRVCDGWPHAYEMAEWAKLKPVKGQLLI